MPKRAKTDQFRSVADFESEMFPKAVEQRETREASEHPRDAGVRLAEELLSNVKPIVPIAAQGRMTLGTGPQES